MLSLDFAFSAPLWKWSDGNWFFVTLPVEMSADIRAFAAERASPLGSVRVEAAVGGSRWQTSLFPSKAHDAFLLPVKAAIRKAERLSEGREVHVALDVFV